MPMKSGEPGFCAQCGAACQAVPVDNGIGHYEYGGFIGWDTAVEPVSPCCESPVLSRDEFTALCEEAPK
jgi:hypothetical protein